MKDSIKIGIALAALITGSSALGCVLGCKSVAMATTEANPTTRQALSVSATPTIPSEVVNVKWRIARTVPKHVQRCELHELEQGGSPSAPFVLVCL